MVQWLKRKVNRWIEKIAKQNQASFGNQRLDCCTIDKGQKRSDCGGGKK